MKHWYFPKWFELCEEGNRVLEGMHRENMVYEYARGKENSNELVNSGEHIDREDNDILCNNGMEKNDILYMK